LITALLAFGCGDDKGKTTIDAPGGGDDAPSIDAPMAALTCAYYCSTIQAACTGAVSQYATMQNCLDTCAKFGTPGALGDMSGDTLGCRIYHAEAAQMTPMVHCPHAGPTGGGVCGTSDCAVFCPLQHAICGTTAYPMNGGSSCMGAQGCSSIATNPPYSSNDQSKNDIQCRFYHLTAAATDPTTHCPHIAVASATCTQ
jgi:hypothetical protein